MLNINQLATLNVANVDALSDVSNAVFLNKLEGADFGSTVKKEYIVTMKKGYDISELEIELENDTTANNLVDSNIVPDRPVEVSDRRPGSSRQTHFLLTFDEANALRNDPRVLDVELNPANNPLLTIEQSAIDYVGNHNFKRLGYIESPAGSRNYALHLCSNQVGTYGTGNTSNTDVGVYKYILDGTGVDVVVMDDGILSDHPEFKDANGVSRVRLIDWYQAAGYVNTAANTLPNDFYTVTGSGHGTHVAGTIAGRSMGWARNANIYNMRIFGSNAMPFVTAYDLIKNFHKNKPINPLTGHKNPTIVNGSWGVSSYYMSSPPNYNPYVGHTIYISYQLWGGNYRGTIHDLYYANVGYGVLGTNTGTYYNQSNTYGTLFKATGFSTAYDAALEDMIEEGVIHVHAAGNDGCKAEDNTGADYNNIYNIITGITYAGFPILSNVYYHRPGSPHANSSINVGSTYYLSINGTNEYRAPYSHFGTGIDVYAPGTGIVSSFSNVTPGFGSVNRAFYTDPYTNVVSNTYYIANDSGTSMAAPQVTGLLSLFLQINPGANAIVCKNWIKNIASSNVLFDTGSNSDYSVTTSISGGPNRFLTNPYAISEEPVLLGDGLEIIDGVFDYKK